MDIHNPWSSISIALPILGTVWFLIAYFNRKKHREPQEGLNKTQRTAILFLPLFLTVFCSLFSTYVPGSTPMIPVYALGIIFCSAAPLLRVSAEWIGVPLKIRQAATQIAWGVVVGFIFLIVVNIISDNLSR